MALIEPVSEKAFKQAAKRLLRVLKEQNPAAAPPPTLAQAQEALCKISGWGSYHALQQHWGASPLLPAPLAAAPSDAILKGPPPNEAESRGFVDAILDEDFVDAISVDFGIEAFEDERGPLGWTAEHEQAWQALPRAYRWEAGTREDIPMSRLEERHGRLKSWSESSDLWKEGLLCADRSSETEFLAWAQNHPEATVALGWPPGEWPKWPQEDDWNYHTYYAFPHHMESLAEWFVWRDVALHVKLCQQAAWPSFVGIRRASEEEDDRGFTNQLWNHPEAQRLLDQVQEHELPQLFKDIERALWPLQFQKNDYVPFAERVSRITPFMNRVAVRVTPHTAPVIRIAWEQLLNALTEHLTPHRPASDWRSAPPKVAPSKLPRVFTFINNNDCQNFTQWVLNKVYAEQEPAWQEALQLLSKAPKDTWREWLLAQGAHVTTLRGVIANRPEGISLHDMVQTSAPHYQVWLELGLPAGYATDATSWHQLRDQPMVPGPF